MTLVETKTSTSRTDKAKKPRKEQLPQLSLERPQVIQKRMVQRRKDSLEELIRLEKQNLIQWKPILISEPKSSRTTTRKFQSIPLFRNSSRYTHNVDSIKRKNGEYDTKYIRSIDLQPGTPRYPMPIVLTTKAIPLLSKTAASMDTTF